MKETKITGSRFQLPDILKGVAVIRMILVHLMAVFATHQLSGSQVGKLVVFLAGPPGAPLFMLIMGYFIAASAKETGISIYRGGKLLVWAFLLNLGMNFHLIVRIINGTAQVEPWPFIFGVDILFVAGFSLMIMAVFKKFFRDNLVAWIILALIFLLGSAFIPKYSGEVVWLTYAQSFFVGNTHWAYFPVFPWVAYPIAGYIFRVLESKYNFSDFSRKGLIYIGSTLFILVVLTFSWGFSITIDFYKYHHHSLIYFLWVLMTVGCWVIIIKLLTMNREQMIIPKYLQWVGRHITNFYVFQWLLIGNIGTAIYKTQGASEIALWFIVLVALASLLVFLWRKLRSVFSFVKS